MKRIISLLMIILIVLSLSACNKNINNNDVSENLDTDSVNRSDVELNANGIQQNNSKDNAIKNLKTGKEYSGLYKIVGYLGNFVEVSGIEVDNTGLISPVAFKFPSYIVSIYNDVLVNIQFDDQNATCQLIDKKTMQPLVDTDENEMLVTLFPEFKYEQKHCGEMPSDVINLSEYESGFVYVFDVQVDDKGRCKLPRINNDTDNSMLFYTVKTDSDLLSRTYVASKFYDLDGSAQWVETNDKKVYIAVDKINAEEMLKINNGISLKDKPIGTKIDQGTCDFLCNDTNNTIILSVEPIGVPEADVILKPNEIAHISWTYFACIKEIQ